jgi:MFS family permease
LTAIRQTPRYTYLIAAIAAIGGMLFGYDIGVISGAENLLKSHFHLSSGAEEFAVAAVLIGSVLGGMIGGRLMNWASRRYALHPARGRLPGRRQELGSRRRDHPAGVRGVLLAVHLPAVLVDEC